MYYCLVYDSTWLHVFLQTADIKKIIFWLETSKKKQQNDCENTSVAPAAFGDADRREAVMF